MKKIIIAGGGTGGHIYPAITIAKAILKLNSEWEVEFVGTAEGLEAKIIPREGFKISFISVGKLNYAGSLFKKIKTLLRLPWSFIKCLALVIEKKPVLVLGVGGYVSGPFVLASSIMGVPTALWEPNAHPGLTNRLLARFVRKCFIVFEEAKKHLKARSYMKVGIPVREEIEKLNSYVDFDNVSSTEQSHGLQKFKVLVFGGSQGARAINLAIKEMFEKYHSELTSFEFIHQTGMVDFQEVNQSYSSHPDFSNIKALEYVYDMDNKYRWADLVICRAGAGTVAEIAASGKPAIFIPLPWAADDHQRKNAEALVSKKAAVMIDQKNLTPRVLLDKIVEIQKDLSLRRQMSENVKHFFFPNAAEKMATQLINLQYENEE
ncbi:MAG: undecaprenyldiphospho-muramoylpentapeptide beta-N-acetylglucosaminyltransferase [Bdellovibrionaceae bacterium]|nr:undecaprenyldiphospho-muramoylpentapeptide beta-N-acetylglucosaminyltransferase [Pseudobdellovibrionaceae bacterium]NUM59741.1 undecaprenyldiphospho-muramoylpentapeptide beta-N-acetylglucosaminyltransferase [Pseudobdellovibrionaceae bacterium]